MNDEELLTGHSGTMVAGAIALVIAAAKWLTGREVKRRDRDLEQLKKVQEEHETRIRAMEVDRVTRGDITFLNQRLDQMRDRAEERHVELLDRIK